ncbi:unnamed protein product [Urochloa humidicola]
MAAAPPSPRPGPPTAHRDGGYAPVSIFLDTDLGTRLVLGVAPDATIRGLKSLVDAEHAAAFPDLGPVAVKSFQVRQKGALYHLSDSLTVTGAFTKIKGRCFLHAKMTRCCQNDGRRSSAGHVGNHVQKHVPELPAMTSEIASDVLPRMLEGGDAAALNDVRAHDALPSLPQLNTEIKKNGAVGLASDAEAGSDPVIKKAKSYSSQIEQANQTEGAYISSTSMENAGKPSDQSNTSHDMEKVHARKEGILHGDGDHDVGGGVSDNMEVRIQEQMLEEIHATDNLSQGKEHKKSRTDSFDTSAPDPPRIANESDAEYLTKSSRAPLEAGTTSHRETLNTSFRQEVQDTLHQDTTENTSTVGKKKERKKRQLAPSKAPAQETSEHSDGAKELSKSTGDVYEVELTGRDDIAVKSSGLALSSSGLNDENHGGKLVQVINGAQASTDLISEQGKFDHALKECRNPSIRDAINSAGEVVASEGGNPKGSINPWNGGEKHEQRKQHDEGSHDEGVAEISNMEKDGKITDALENRQTNDAASQLKKRKKAKKASSVDFASVDTAHEKEMHGYREHATRTDTVSTEKEIVHDPSTQRSTNNVHQVDSDMMMHVYREHATRTDTVSTEREIVHDPSTQRSTDNPSTEREKHEQIKQHDERSHDEGVAEISNMEKDGKSTDALEKRQINDDASQLKKRKKAKKSSSVDFASVDTAHEKEMSGYGEHATRRDTVSTEREIVHDPSAQRSTNNVHQGDSNMMENPNGDGKKKKRRRRHSEYSKGVDPSQDLTKSSEFGTTESSMHFRGGAPLDAKQTSPDGIEGATVIDNKELGENLAAKNVIDEVLADLRSKDSSSKNLDEDTLTGQTHLGSNKNALELPESTVDKVSVTAALPPKYPAAVHSDALASSPRLKKSKEENLKVHSNSVPEDANRKLNESDSFRFSDKTSDPKDILTGDVVAQADDKPKATKRRRKKVSLIQVPADNGKTLDEQVSQFDALCLKGENVTQANLFRGNSVVDTPLSTVGKVEQKSRSSKTRTATVQETHCSTPGLDSHLAKDSQNEYVTNVTGSHNNENTAGAATEMPGVHKDVMALKSASPNVQKPKKRSSKFERQSLDSSLEHGSRADLGNLRSEKSLISPKNSADATEPNCVSVVRPASDAINFIDHFGSSKINDSSVSVEHKQNNEDETLKEVKNKKKNKIKQGTGSIEPNDVLESLPTGKTSLIGHLGTSKAIVPFAAENMNSEDDNEKNGKEKKRKRKANMEKPVAEKESLNFDNQGTEKTNMEDATLEKKLDQNGVDDQSKMLTDEDHAHMSKDARKSTSKVKPHGKSKNESIKGRATSNPKPVRNLVKDFSTSPLVSSDSTEGTPQNANRYRVAIRKVPIKRYEQTSDKSKKENRKVGSGAIFNDANSEGSDDELDTKKVKSVMEASPDSSATSGDSGISSAAYDESDPDDDGNMSLSQKSLRDGLDIGSILRGSSSYKMVRKRQSELFDDDTEVPDSQPADGPWD